MMISTRTEVNKDDPISWPYLIELQHHEILETVEDIMHIWPDRYTSRPKTNTQITFKQVLLYQREIDLQSQVAEQSLDGFEQQ